MQNYDTQRVSNYEKQSLVTLDRSNIDYLLVNNKNVMFVIERYFGPFTTIYKTNH